MMMMMMMMAAQHQVVSIYVTSAAPTRLTAADGVTVDPVSTRPTGTRRT